MSMETKALKLYPETLALYQKLFEESESQTADQFINYLLENLKNPRRVEVSKKEDADTIANLQAEILRLTNQPETSLPADTERIEELTAEIETLTRQLSEQTGLLPNQIVMDLSDQQHQQVIDNVEKYKARGQEVEPWEVLVALIANGLLLKD